VKKRKDSEPAENLSADDEGKQDKGPCRELRDNRLTGSIVRPERRPTRSLLLRWSILLAGLLGVAPLLGGSAPSSGHGRELESTPYMFVSWADTKLGRDVLSELSDQAVRLDPAFSIFPGDLEDWGFTQDGMDQWKQAMDGGLTGDAPPNGMSDIVFAVRGNHDALNSSGWQAYFDFQATANRVGATHYTDMPGEQDRTYSFDYQNAHFIGVDVPGNAFKITSARIQWIDADLAVAEARGLTHAFIFFHGPIYCVGPHCGCSARVCSIGSRVQDLIEVLNRHPIVSATFHGHAHTYAYTYIDETRIPPDGSFEGVTHPFRQFVTGCAGAETRTCTAYRCDYNLPESGFVAVEVDGPKVTVTFYQRGSMDPVNPIRFIKQGAAGP